MRITIRSTNQNIRNDDTQEPKDNIRNNKYEAKVTGILGSQKKKLLAVLATTTHLVVSNSRLNFYSSETSLLRRKVEFLISLEQLLSENTPPITRHMQSRWLI